MFVEYHELLHCSCGTLDKEHGMGGIMSLGFFRERPTAEPQPCVLRDLETAHSSHVERDNTLHCLGAVVSSEQMKIISLASFQRVCIASTH